MAKDHIGMDRRGRSPRPLAHSILLFALGGAAAGNLAALDPRDLFRVRKLFPGTWSNTCNPYIATGQP